MKRYWIIFIILCGLSYSCERKEDQLKPSYKDVDRVATQIDLSKPTIKDIYETYDVGLLYEYDRILDFAYVASTISEAQKWGGVQIPLIESLFTDSLGEIPADTMEAFHQYIDQGVTFLDTNLFRHLDPALLSAANINLPGKVLLSASIYSDIDLAVATVSESESRTTSRSEGTLSSIYNNQAIVFDLNPENLMHNPRQLVIDNFYVFLSKVLEMNNLYARIPEGFYGTKRLYYGKEMRGIYGEEMGLDSITTAQLPIIDKDWFFEQGFVDARYFYNRPGGLSNVSYRDEDNRWVLVKKGLRPYYTFVTRTADLRSYINEMLHRSASEITDFPENIQENMRLLLDLFTSWGIDIAGINPELEVLNN